MDKADFVAVVAALQNAGCRLVVGVPSLGGLSSRTLSPEQAYLLTTDRPAAFASLLGLTRPEYLEWHESQGTVYCSALTKEGAPCRNTVAGATWLCPEEWKARRAAGGFCAAHGAQEDGSPGRMGNDGF
ncbi:hypothetical protein AAGS40_27335 (plasmid) [Paraburkholderia sp. PREW-6R]|uniref:hypothetical protein n=1 Tax=Paraburkholderia sp. PREW-6R TaxID=3141544 RepID=UPI0031F57730